LPTRAALATVGLVTVAGVAIGVVTRTGSAVMVMLGGFADAPDYMARGEMDLVSRALPAQPYHAAADLGLAAAEEMIGQVERGAEEAAAAGLRGAAGGLPAGAAVLGVAVVVKAVSLPASLADIMRSHAWMHTAEGMLYRDAVLDAARRCGWAAHAVEMSSLPDAEQSLGVIGRAAGHPWRRIEKDAARAAITLLTRRSARPTARAEPAAPASPSAGPASSAATGTA
jgi:hypothetical protein